MYMTVVLNYLLVAVVTVSLGFEYNSQYLTPQDCKTCDAMSCPELIYCAGTKVKDNCGCCERCSSDLFQPHAQLPPAEDDAAGDTPVQETHAVDACEARQCPRFKVCMINIQGLPICTCPTRLVCDPRRKKKNGMDTTLCGSDGVTYESRCHMRVANCEKGKRIRRKHAGACLIDEQISVFEDANLPTTFPEDGMTDDEARIRLKAIEKGKRRRQKRKKLKERRKKKKERKLKKNKEKRRRMKRRNNNSNVYSNQYGKMIGKYTKWGRSQIRKSRI